MAGNVAPLPGRMLQHAEDAGNGERSNRQSQQCEAARRAAIGFFWWMRCIRLASAQVHVGQEHLDLRLAAWSRLQERR